FAPEWVALGYYTEENADDWLDINKFMRWLGHKAQNSSATPPATPAARGPQPQQQPHWSSSQALPPSSPIPTTSSPLPPRVPSSNSRLATTSHASSSTERNTSTQRGINILADSDDEDSFVYRVDISKDPRQWLDSKKNPLSMAAIIKSEDQDSWGGGSAGAVNPSKATKVLTLGGVLCQVAKHTCQGVYVCSQLDVSLLDGHERYEPNDDDMRELFVAEREVNVRETSSMAIRAAAFYKEICSKKCPHRDANGLQCTGAPMNFDGKYGFIGCQNYRSGEARSHRFVTIWRDVKEDLLRELLTNDGVFISDVGVDPESAVCARVLHPRNGGKGARLCPYTHIGENQQVINAPIIHRPCTSTIRIFSPLDHSDRRAIIHLSGPHNHPKFPSTKMSRSGKDAYREAIAAAGVTGLTVVKCDSAPSTSKIFGGKIPGVVDPALSNPRLKRKLIQEFKTVQNPHGLGIEGVIYYQKQMRSLPHEKQYIWNVASENGEEIVITMLPYLANLIHNAKASLHDNTYARLHGVWKEWEIVIWHHRDDFRVTIGRIYSQHETLEVFMKMWPGLFDTIRSITKSEVKFKFIDGEGLQAILVDGNKPQANALGAYLVNRNRPHLSGIHERDPKLILLNILRTCIFHVNRKFASMALIVPDVPMGRIRRSPYLKTQQEIDDFVQWCKESEYKVVRDWIADKDSIPWFFPSINQFLSKIPEEDWYLTPGNTNLNESAHPYTNQHTGTNLSLLEAIQTAYKLDLSVEEKLRAIDINCVLPNHLNTKPHRDHRNDARRSSHFRQAVERSEARLELESIDDAIQNSTALTRELREKKKLLQNTTGVKKTKRKGEKGKDKHPDENELA
ncbi:hypothetical protein B0H11DRAFT_1660472, partial [Mycena galericulata]